MTYAVHCNPHFFAGDIHGSDKAHVLSSPYSGTSIALATRADADAICTMLNDTGNGQYMLAHNQYAPPEYRVIESAKPPMRLAQAMLELDLQYDFAADGSRLPPTCHY